MTLAPLNFFPFIGAAVGGGETNKIFSTSFHSVWLICVGVIATNTQLIRFLL